MQTYTTELPVLLIKLEVIRQVLEAQGVETDNEDNPGDMVWTWQRGHIQMQVMVAPLDWYVMFSLATASRDTCVDVTWHMEGQPHLWTIRAWSRAERLPWFEELKSELRTRGLCPEAGTKDDFNVPECQARKAMGMIADFFVKLPVDAPAETAVTA